METLLKKQKESIANKVKDFRTVHGLTQTQFGQAANISKVTVWQIENMKNAPSLITLLKIAKLMNATVDEMLS